MPPLRPKPSSPSPDPTSGSDSESETEILPRAEKAPTPKIIPDEPKQPEAQSSDDGSDDGEEEYEVETILGHNVFNNEKSMRYHVKWKGYSEEFNTWEPKKNFEGAIEKLHKYWEIIGGEPEVELLEPPSGRKRGRAKKSKTESGKKLTPSNKQTKRKADEDTGGKKRLRRQSTGTNESVSRVIRENGNGADNGEATQWEPPRGNWEKDVDKIDGMERSHESGDIKIFVQWKDGHESSHAKEEIYQKCPQLMLRYFESHLAFEK